MSRFVACCLLAFALPAVAREPGLVLPHQGRLFDSSDTAVDGLVDLSFKLFEKHEPGPGEVETPLWNATFAQTLVTKGLYAVVLGQNQAQPLPAALFEDAAERWLEVSVNGVAMKPRLRIGSMPRAVSAWKADDARALEGHTLADLDERYARATNGQLDAGRVTGKLGSGVSYEGAPIADSQIASAETWNAKVSPNDPRLSDARAPTANSAHYVWNGAEPQNASFNLLGDGTLGGNLRVGGVLALGNGLCSPGVVGALRYNAPAGRVEFCNGTGWQPVGGPRRTCVDLRDSGVTTSGPHRLQPPWGKPFDAECDMDFEGGGWTKVTGALIQAQNWMHFEAVSWSVNRQPSNGWFDAEWSATGVFELRPHNAGGCIDDITIRATVRLPFLFNEYRGSWKGDGSHEETNHDDDNEKATWGSRDENCSGHVIFGTDTHVAKRAGTWGTNWNHSGKSRVFQWPTTRILPTNELRWESEENADSEGVRFSQIEIWVR